MEAAHVLARMTDILPISSTKGPIEDEYHAIFDCPGYTYAREQFQDLFQSHITTVSQILNQPQRNRLAKFLKWIRACRMNKA